MKTLKNISAVFVIVFALALQGCGASNFATDLRLALAVSSPFIESLNLGGRRAAIVADFTELGTDAATMADSINACAGKKQCELSAVQVFEGSFESVANRDFQNIPELQTVESLVRGILEAAKIYYGSKTAAVTAHTVDPLTTIRQKTAQLKALTHGS